MAGTITRDLFPLDLEDITKSWYDVGLKQHPAIYKDVFNTVNSDQAYERYANMVGFTRLQEIAEGAAAQYQTARQLHDGLLRNIKYGMATRMTREMVEDGQVLKFAEKVGREFAKAEVTTMNALAFNVLNRAHNSSYTGNDGKELCATDHPTGVGTESNELATAADLSESMLEELTIQIGNAKGLNGEPIMLKPEKLVIGENEKYEHIRILKGQYRVGTGDNDLNALNHMKVLQTEPVVVPNGYLTDEDAVFILTNHNMNDEGLIYQLRRDVEITMDNDFDTDNKLMKITKRCAFGWNGFYGVYSNGGGAA